MKSKSVQEPAHDFSQTSTRDLIQMLKDRESDGLTAEFIAAVREEIQRRVALNPFTEDRMPRHKPRRYLYQYDSPAHKGLEVN